MIMIKYILVLSALLLFQTSSAELINDEISSSNNSFSFTDETFFNLKMKFQRKGFEVFYNLTNKFIDEVFKPNIPKGTIEDLIEKYIPRKTIDYIRQPYKLYPSLVYFTIGVVVTSILISFVGFCVFAYRCCCKKKLNPYDRKCDSFRRKFNALVMFIILMAIMICIVILFFTNKNSTQAAHNIPEVLSKLRKDLNFYNDEEMPKFYNSIATNLKFDKNETNDIRSDIVENYVNNYMVTLKDTAILKEIRSKMDSIKESAALLFKDDINELENFQEIFSLDATLEGFNRFLLNEIETRNSNINLNLSRPVNVTVSMVKSNIDIMMKYINDDVTPKANSFWKLFQVYYDYVYFSLTVICVFILFLFLIFGTGLAGICARRAQFSIKRTCHRGVLSRLLLSGCGFFFLFSWIILLFSVTLYVPGVSFRQFICKPAIEIENNQLVQNVLQTYNLSETKFTKIIRECDKSNHSSEISSTIHNYLTNIISNEFSVNEMLADDKDTIPVTLKLFGLKFAQGIDAAISELSSKANGKSKKDIDDLIAEMTSLTEFAEKKEELENDLFKAERLTKEHAIKKLIQSLKEKIKMITDNESSCKIISNSYKKVVNVACYEYLDNYNTFWFFLLIAILLNFIMTYFAIKQADLFRKSYPYDGVHEQMLMNDNSSYKDVHIYSNRSNGSYSRELKKSDAGAIDAFEMDGYHRYGQYKGNDNIAPQNRGTPPPKYYN